jgi:hypothetical protein
MKKVIYFLTLLLLATSCQLLKSPVYDDVYTQATLDTEIDETNGYADYIKKQEKRYTVKPDSAHNTWAGDGYVNRKDPFSKSSYCYTHNFTHTIAESGPYCNFNAYNGLFNSNNPLYQNGYNYNIYNQYNCYNQNYNPYGFNNYCGYIVYGSGYNNYGYYGNSYYYGNPYLGNNFGYTNYYNSNNNWASNNSSIEPNTTSSGYHYTGHRNGNYSGTYNSNNTTYPNTVKSTNEGASLPLIEPNTTSPKVKKQSVSQVQTINTTKAINKWDVVSYKGTSRSSSASKYKVPVSHPPRTYSSNPSRTSYNSGGSYNSNGYRSSNSSTNSSNKSHSSSSSNKGSTSSGRSGSSGSSSRR